MLFHLRRHLAGATLLAAIAASALPGSVTPALAASPSPSAATCSVWSLLGVATADQELRGVTYLAKGKALLVGADIHASPDRETPHREKWTGTSFVKVKGPQPTAPETMALDRVARIDGTNTAWAVGRSSLGARIEKYDGTRFTTARLLASGALNSVDVDPSGRAWAVGTADPYGSPKPMILRSTGGAWSKVALPSSLPGGALNDVFARTATDAWAVGMSTTGGAIIVHWNGTAWKKVAPWTKPAGLNGQIIRGVAATKDAVIVVGADLPTSGDLRPFSMTWDGQGWTRHEVPANSFGPAGLNDLAVTPDGTFYAVGSRYDGDQAQALIVRSTGGEWTRMPFNSVTPIILDDIAARSNAQLMTVGSPASDTSHRVVLRCTPA